jgi:hypothetical protein
MKKPEIESVEYYDANEVRDYINSKYKLSVSLNDLLDDNLKNDSYCDTCTWSMSEELKHILKEEFGTSNLLLWVCW